MTAVNAFNWKEYTEQEINRRGSPFKELERNAAISKRTTESVEKIRITTPSHGTVHGITSKPLKPRPTEMMRCIKKKS
jgi:hypothetical protein